MAFIIETDSPGLFATIPPSAGSVSGDPGEMSKSITEEIRDCYKQAKACARQAAAKTDPQLREDFLALETAWLKLARLRERDLSDRIRGRAYELWIASGSHGEAEQHWLAAEREVLSAVQSPEELGRVPTATVTSEAELK